MEETEKAKNNYINGNSKPIAGIKSTENFISPANYAWPSNQNGGNENDEDDEGEDYHDSHHKLAFNDVHTEYRDNYIKWAIEKVYLFFLIFK